MQCVQHPTFAFSQYLFVMCMCWTALDKWLYNYFIITGLNQLFMLVMTGMIVVNTINMGAQLDLDVVREVFKKPIGKLSIRPIFSLLF